STAARARTARFVEHLAHRQRPGPAQRQGLQRRGTNMNGEIARGGRNDTRIAFWVGVVPGARRRGQRLASESSLWGIGGAHGRAHHPAAVWAARCGSFWGARRLWPNLSRRYAVLGWLLGFLSPIVVSWAGLKVYLVFQH